MNTPKERFLVSGVSKQFSALVAAPAFEIGCDYALLQFMSELPPNRLPNLPIDPCTGLDANAQLAGARRFIDILKTLHEPVKEPTPVKQERLHY